MPDSKPELKEFPKKMLFTKQTDTEVREFLNSTTEIQQSFREGDAIYLHLKPFAPDCPFTVNTALKRHGRMIVCQFYISGPIEELIYSQGSDTPGGFKEGLWHATCFELFTDLGLKYIEWNLTKDQSWTCYEFTDYRRLSKKLTKAYPRDFTIEERPGHMSIRFSLPIQGAISALSPCCILKLGEVFYYFAHRHVGSKPDFHLRQSFVAINK